MLYSMGEKATHNYANPTPNPNPNYCHIGNPQCQWDYPSYEELILYGFRRKSSWMLHAVRVMNYFAQSLVHTSATGHCRAVIRARRQRGGSRLPLAVNRHSVGLIEAENQNMHRIHEPNCKISFSLWPIL